MTFVFNLNDWNESNIFSSWRPKSGYFPNRSLNLVHCGISLEFSSPIDFIVPQIESLQKYLLNLVLNPVVLKPAASLVGRFADSLQRGRRRCKTQIEIHSLTINLFLWDSQGGWGLGSLLFYRWYRLGSK